MKCMFFPFQVLFFKLSTRNGNCSMIYRIHSNCVVYWTGEKYLKMYIYLLIDLHSISNLQLTSSLCVTADINNFLYN